MAQKLKFISNNPAEDTRMPETKAVDRPTMTAEQIVQLVNGIEDPHDLCLMSIGLFCATRTSETLGLQWKSYTGETLIIHGTAYEGRLYEGKVKTDASRDAVPVPADIRPVIESWRHLCPDTSPEALMFPNLRPEITNRSSQWKKCAKTSQELLKMAHLAHCRQAGDSQKACDLSGNATHTGNRSAALRNHERRAADFATR